MHGTAWFQNLQFKKLLSQQEKQLESRFHSTSKTRLSDNAKQLEVELKEKHSLLEEDSNEKCLEETLTLGFAAEETIADLALITQLNGGVVGTIQAPHSPTALHDAHCMLNDRIQPAWLVNDLQLTNDNAGSVECYFSVLTGSPRKKWTHSISSTDHEAVEAVMNFATSS